MKPTSVSVIYGSCMFFGVFCECRLIKNTHLGLQIDRAFLALTLVVNNA